MLYLKNFFLILWLGVSLKSAAQVSISSISPAAGPIGTTLTIYGNGFDPITSNNLVYLGAVQAPVTFASTDSIRITIPAGSNYKPVSVTNTNSTAYSPKPFVVTFSCGGAIDSTAFAAKADFTTGAFPFSIDAADFDGDGKADLATANQNANSVSVFRNTGSVGTVSFAPRTDVAVGSTPYGLVAGDVDGDGKLDLVVSNYGASTVSVLLNTSSVGFVSFAAKVDLATGLNPYHVSIADLDYDGKPDVVAANYNANTISILKNTSTPGVVSFAAKVDVATGINPADVTIADLNADGKADIAVANNSSASISVFKNTCPVGTISFAAKIDFSVSNGPYSVAAGDLDGDGKADLVAANYLYNTVSVLRNTTAGVISFATKLDLATTQGPMGVGLSDIDGDGVVDIAASDYISQQVSVFKNNSTPGSLSFNNKVDFATANLPAQISIDDLDGDGRADIASCNATANSISVLRSQLHVGPVMTSPNAKTIISGDSVNIVLSSTIPSTYQWIAGNNPNTTGESLTLQSSGKISDVITNNSASQQFVIYTVTPSPIVGFCSGTAQTLTVTVSKSPPVITSFSPTNGPVGTTLTINGLNFSSVPANNKVYLGSVKTTVSSASSTQLVVTVPAGADYKPISVTTGFNLTGYSLLPFVTTFACGDTVVSNSFSAKTDYTTGIGPEGIASGDFNGDGKTDVVVANNGATTFSVFKNTSSGSVSFAAKVDFTAGNNPYGITVADFDGDGKLDVAVANGVAPYVVSVFRNTSSISTISFAAKVDLAANSYPRGVTSQDLDGDGKPELIVACLGGNVFSSYKNQCSPGIISFAAKVDFSTGNQALGICSSDLDGDGRPEVIVTSASAYSFAVFKNTTSGSISFAPQINYPASYYTSGVSAGDLDGDGKIDLAVTVSNNDTLAVYKNLCSPGNILLDVPKYYKTPRYPYGTCITDVDGDAAPDIIVADAYNGVYLVSVFKNAGIAGQISFDPKVDFATGGNAQFVTVNDFDGDSKPDIAATNNNSNSISVLPNQDYKIPAVTSTSTMSILSGDSAYIVLTANVPSTFTWVAANNPNVTGESVTTQTTGIINNILINNATTNQIVSYTVTPTSTMGCGIGTSQVVNVEVRVVPPSIFSVNPVTGPVGTTVIITGANFNTTPSNNLVLFGATKANVLASTATSLTVTVPYGASDQYVTVANKNHTAYSPKDFLPTFSCNDIVTTASFAPKTTFNITNGAVSTVVEDFDQDGKPDLAMVHTPNMISIFPNTSSTGTISFGTAVTYPATQNSQDITTADFDGDGKMDIAVPDAGFSLGWVSVYLNNSTPGSISFLPRVDFSVAYDPESITSEDLDGDGRPEIVTGNFNGNALSVLRNLSIPGTVSFAAHVDFASGTEVHGVAIGDLDGDGKPDIVNADRNVGGTGYVTVYQNQSTTGTIALGAPISYTVGQAPLSVSLNDYDGDGKLDIATPNAGTNNVSILRNTSAGSISFAPKIDFNVASVPYKTAAGDINGDGMPDLAVASSNSSSVSVIRNTSSPGNVSFAPKVDYAVGSGVYVVAVNDLDADGRPEIIELNQGTTFSVFRNLVNGGTYMTSVNTGTICSGSTIVIPLTSNTAATYTWVAGSNFWVNGEVLTPQTSDTLKNTLSLVNTSPQTIIYTVTPMSTIGCPAGTSQTVTVTINPTTGVTFDLSSNTFCVTDSAIILSATPANGTFSGQGVSGSQFDPGAAGVGSFILSYNFTNVFGCASQDTALANVQLCSTSINAHAVETLFNVQPNPSNENIKIIIDRVPEEIVVLNGQGGLVRRLDKNEMKTEMEIKGLSQGIYFVQIKTSSGTLTKKIIIQH